MSYYNNGNKTTNAEDEMIMLNKFAKNLESLGSVVYGSGGTRQNEPEDILSEFVANQLKKNDEEKNQKMSMVPMLFRDWWDDVEVSRPSRLLDQHFGTALNREELLSTISNFPRTSVLNRYYRPWRTLAKTDSGSTIAADAEKFQVILDVQQFAPEDITVKVNNGSIIVEGKHEEKQDEHGFVARHFVRRYVVPKEHDVDGVVSTLSSDGVLTVSVPKKGKEEKGERVVPITQTGPAKAE